VAKILARRGSKAKRTADEITAVIARRGLTVHQRLAVHALVMSATRTQALELLRENGVNIDKSTLSRWFNDGDFRVALKAAEAAVAESITKHSVLRKSEAVLEKAMEGTPILGYVGKDEQEIVGYKPDLPTAARVVEMQGKAVGLFADSDIMKLAVLVDVDFSGRKEPIVETPKQVLDADFVNAALIDAAPDELLTPEELELATVDADIRRAEAAAAFGALPPQHLNGDDWLG